MDERMHGAAGNGTHDNARGGTLWALLFHPGNTVKPQEPITIPAWRAPMEDPKGNGYVLFRTGWQHAGSRRSAPRPGGYHD